MFDRIRRNIAKHVALTDDEFRYFASLLRQTHVKRSQPLLRSGEICRFEGFVDRGCLRVYCANPDGSDQILYFAPEDWWVCDIQSFLSETPAALGIDALEDSEVLLIDRFSKERLYADVPKFERLFRIMTQRALVALQKRLVASMRQTAEGRYLDFQRRYPGLERRVSQYQIASYLGICPEFLSKVRRKLALRAGARLS